MHAKFDKNHKYPVKSKLNHLGVTVGLAYVCLNFLLVGIGVSVYFRWIEFKRKITFVSSASCYKWWSSSEEGWPRGNLVTIIRRSMSKMILLC